MKGQITNVFWLGLTAVGLLTVDIHARMMECPEGDAIHHAEATATSAPEVKVRSNSDLRSNSDQIKPLTLKALRLARAERATAMQRGIEEACPAPQVYMGEIAEHRSGCETRVVTRSSDAGHEWAQVIAICKYDWSCCSPLVSKTSSSVGVTLEGPIAGQASPTTETGPAKPSKK